MALCSTAAELLIRSETIWDLSWKAETLGSNYGSNDLKYMVVVKGRTEKRARSLVWIDESVVVVVVVGTG